MNAVGNGVGGVVVSNKYGLPKLKMSSTHPSGVMSRALSQGKLASWIQRHLTLS
jgi:hypothetical protein